jgi:hypothetical protein
MTTLVEPELQVTGPIPQSHKWSNALFCVPPIALIIGLLALHASSVSHIGNYGLIQAVSHWYYLGVGLVIVGFVLALQARYQRTLLLSLHLAVFVFLLHGAPGVIESEPRFATAWLHAGFTNYVATHGAFLPLLDARFSWPSFFGGVGLLDRAAGISSAVSLIRWWPVAMNLLYLPFIFQIARQLLANDTMAWVATGLFPIMNWVGQDYFSPQSVGMLLYLAFVYLLIGPLGGDGMPVWTWLRRHRESRWPDPVAPPGSAGLDVRFLIGCALLVMVAMATGHQLSPVMACGSAVILVAAGRTRIRYLAVACVLITLGWVFYGAVSFWGGHPGELFGQIGAVSSNLTRAVAKRLHGTAPHQFIVDARLVMSAFVWLMGLGGAIRWRGTRSGRSVAFLLMAWPIGLLGLQSYGGEALLRIYLFSLPGAVCLASSLLFSLRAPIRSIATGMVLALLVPLFMFARWGNEIFEYVRPDAIAGVEHLYDIAPPGSTLVSITPQIPWLFKDLNIYHYEPSNLDEFALRQIVPIERLFQKYPGTDRGYVIITIDQVLYGWQEYGLPENWGTQVEHLLETSKSFELVYTNPDTFIFKYVPHGR